MRNEVELKSIYSRSEKKGKNKRHFPIKACGKIVLEWQLGRLLKGQTRCNLLIMMTMTMTMTMILIITTQSNLVLSAPDHSR